MIRLLTLAATILVPLTAQQTFVVDSGGATPYQQIQPAINAAAAGDIVVVLPGVYSPFTCSKALRIQGSPGAIVAGNVTTLVLTVSGIPAGSSCTISQLRMQSPVVPCGCEPTMLINQCDGLVILDGVGFGSGSLPPKLHMTDAAAVLVSHSNLGPVRLTASQAQFTQCNVNRSSQNSGNVIDLVSSTLDITDGSIICQNSNAIRLSNSTARLRVVDSMNISRIPGFSFDFVGGSQSTVVYHPQIPFPFGMPAISGPQLNVVVSDDLPALEVTTAGLGGTVIVDMNYTPAFGFIVPFLSTPGGPFVVPGITGTFFTGGPFQVSLGTFAMSTGQASTSFGIPNLAALSGQPFTMQGIALNTAFAATNANVFTIR